MGMLIIVGSGGLGRGSMGGAECGLNGTRAGGAVRSLMCVGEGGTLVC